MTEVYERRVPFNKIQRMDRHALQQFRNAIFLAASSEGYYMMEEFRDELLREYVFRFYRTEKDQNNDQRGIESAHRAVGP